MKTCIEKKFTQAKDCCGSEDNARDFKNLTIGAKQ